MIERIQQKRQQGEGGFTLVELLVVIVILGILAAIVVFAVGGVKDKGQVAACNTDYSTLASASEAYYASQKVAPVYGDEATLVANGFLHEASTLHTLTLGGTPVGSTYAIGKQAPDGTVCPK